MLFLIVISIALGITFANYRSYGMGKLFTGISSFNDIMMRLANAIILLSPIGIFGLIAQLVVSTGIDALIPLIFYVITAMLGLGIHALIVLPIALKSITGVPPIRLAKHVMPSLLTGFSTASSAATLPLLMDDCRKNEKIPTSVTSFVLPLGITVNMNGTAVFQAIAAIFIAQIYGIELPLLAMGIISLTTLVAAIGAAAIPSAGLITLTMILSAVGLPIEGIGLVFGIDRLIDMLRTTTNLWGNAVSATIITHFLGDTTHANNH